MPAEKGRTVRIHESTYSRLAKVKMPAGAEFPNPNDVIVYLLDLYALRKEPKP